MKKHAPATSAESESKPSHDEVTIAYVPTEETAVVSPQAEGGLHSEAEDLKE